MKSFTNEFLFHSSFRLIKKVGVNCANYIYPNMITSKLDPVLKNFFSSILTIIFFTNAMLRYVTLLVNIKKLEVIISVRLNSIQQIFVHSLVFFSHPSTTNPKVHSIMIESFVMISLTSIVRNFPIFSQSSKKHYKNFFHDDLYFFSHFFNHRFKGYRTIKMKC